MGSSLISCLKFKQQESPEQNQEAVWRELEYLASDGKLLLFVDNVDEILEIFKKRLGERHARGRG